MLQIQYQPSSQIKITETLLGTWSSFVTFKVIWMYVHLFTTFTCHDKNDLQDVPSSVPVYFVMVVKILIFLSSNNQGLGQKGASISEVKRKWLIYFGWHRGENFTPQWIWIPFFFLERDPYKIHLRNHYITEPGYIYICSCHHYTFHKVSFISLAHKQNTLVFVLAQHTWTHLDGLGFRC